jgi:predicted regulator of Ras-like GTPase activity (Roadblock/LC7/MglB family)
MKLFVVGSTSPNPEDWSCWSDIHIVVANSAEEALKLADDGTAQVCEISMDKANVILTRYGADESKDY